MPLTKEHIQDQLNNAQQQASFWNHAVTVLSQLIQLESQLAGDQAPGEVGIPVPCPASPSAQSGEDDATPNPE